MRNVQKKKGHKNIKLTKSMGTKYSTWDFTIVQRHALMILVLKSDYLANYLLFICLKHLIRCKKEKRAKLTHTTN